MRRHLTAIIGTEPRSPFIPQTAARTRPGAAQNPQLHFYFAMIYIGIRPLCSNLLICSIQ